MPGKEKRTPLKILGRVLGTFAGWDGDPGELVWFYDFQPAEGVDLPTCDSLQFNEIDDQITACNADGVSFADREAVLFLAKLPRSI